MSKKNAKVALKFVNEWEGNRSDLPATPSYRANEKKMYI